uniref:Uncharacterized protein n=1 Tax=Anguilla anguilla TaxID=7936 RepID=A0A0E9TUL3_ANGAN
MTLDKRAMQTPTVLREWLNRRPTRDLTELFCTIQSVEFTSLMFNFALSWN